MSKSSTYPFSAVVGQDDLRLALVLLAIDPGIGGVLIRGQKGTAKTTAVRGLARLVPAAEERADPAGSSLDSDPADAGVSAPFVELPLGATEDRVVGSLDLDALVESGRPSFRPGLLSSAHGGLLYVDEVNLLADHLVDVLLDAAASGRLTVERDGMSHSVPARFALVGTMNPEEGELRPQLLDRFGLTVDVASPSDASQRVEIVRRRRAFDTNPDAVIEQFAAADAEYGAAIAAARTLLPAVTIPDRELHRIALICLEVGVEGMRADVVIARTASAYAAYHGRAEVTVDDVRTAATLALPHRRRRDPFDPAEMDSGELDRAMDAADQQLGQDNAAESQDSGSAGPAEPSEDGPPEGPEDPTDGPGGGAGVPEDSPLPDSGASSTDSPEEPSSPARSRPITPDRARSDGPAAVLKIDGSGRGATGRRSAAITTSGRLDAAQSTVQGARMHVLNTLRAAAVRRIAEGHPTSIVRDDLRWGIRRGKEANLVVFLVDTSGSMAARRRLDLVTGSCVALLRDAYIRRDLVAVVEAHGGDAQVAVPPTRSVDVAVRRLAQVDTGGRTPLAEGLTEVETLVIRHRRTEPERRALLVVLTDGRATAGSDALPRALAAARRVRGCRLASLVVDCESGRIRLGSAVTLARELGAPVLSLDDLTNDTVAHLVRGAA